MVLPPLLIQAAFAIKVHARGRDGDGMARIDLCRNWVAVGLCCICCLFEQKIACLFKQPIGVVNFVLLTLPLVAKGLNISQSRQPAQ